MHACHDARIPCDGEIRAIFGVQFPRTLIAGAAIEL
jgi:hypothetical protein